MRWDLILYFIQFEYEHLTIIAVCRPPKATQGQQRKKSNSSVPALPIYRACSARRPCRFTHVVRPALHRHFISQGNAQVSCELSESERLSERVAKSKGRRGEVHEKVGADNYCGLHRRRGGQEQYVVNWRQVKVIALAGQ